MKTTKDLKGLCRFLSEHGEMPFDDLGFPRSVVGAATKRGLIQNRIIRHGSTGIVCITFAGIEYARGGK